MKEKIKKLKVELQKYQILDQHVKNENAMLRIRNLHL